MSRPDYKLIEEIRILAETHGIPDVDYILDLADAVEVSIEIIDHLSYELRRATVDRRSGTDRRKHERRQETQLSCETCTAISKILDNARSEERREDRPRRETPEQWSTL